VTSYLPIIVAVVALGTYMNIAEHLLSYLNRNSRAMNSFDEQALKDRFKDFKLRLNQIKNDIHHYYLFLRNKESIVDSVIDPKYMIKN
jgi:hypothetical protein